MFASNPNRPSWRKRLQALLCLLALLSAHAELLPALLALGAAVEASHKTHVVVRDGEFKIILSHEQPQDQPCALLHGPANAPHRHGLSANVLCLLGGATSPLADHEAIFTLGSPAESSFQNIRVSADLEISLFFPNKTRLVALVSPATSHLVKGRDDALELLNAFHSTLLLV